MVGNNEKNRSYSGLVRKVEKGLILIMIIETPILIMILASIFGSPRKFRVTGLFIGSLILLLAALVIGTAVIGMMLELFIP